MNLDDSTLKGVSEKVIYVITHKKFDESILKESEYKVLHVGTNKNSKPSYLRDDTGDNISNKNPHYCELTGLYWLWKNAQESEKTPVGLVHYRRFFTYGLDDLLYTYLNKSPRILTDKDIRIALNSYDVILPKPEKIYRTVSKFYGDYHNPDDLVVIRDVIEKLYPDYIDSFDRVMNEHYFYFGNMFITRKELMDEYCEWLFDIMSVLEQRIVGDEIADTYQSRIYGFISERLLQVWVEHNKLNVKTYPVFNTEIKRMTVFQKNLNRVKHAVARRK